MTTTLAARMFPLRTWWNGIDHYIREGILAFLADGTVPACVIGDLIEENNGDREWTGALLSWHRAIEFFSIARSSRWYSCQDKAVYLDCAVPGSNHVQTVRIGFQTVGERMSFGQWWCLGQNPGDLRRWVNEHMGEFTFA